VAFNFGSGLFQRPRKRAFSLKLVQLWKWALSVVPKASLEVCQISGKPYILQLQEYDFC